jgi:hypothetical protein
MKRILLASYAFFLISGCVTAPQSKYDWGNYEQSMYNYYKNPSNPDELMLSMADTIKAAEATSRNIGPGLYAEYGYLLMIQGKQQEALVYFEKEKSKWPESSVLMDKLSKLAQTQSGIKGSAK